MKKLSTLFLVLFTVAFISVSHSEETDKSKKQLKAKYHPSRVIIKFKDESLISAVADDLFEQGQAFETLTDDDHLDLLNQHFGVKKMRRLMNDGNKEKKKAFITKSMARNKLLKRRTIQNAKIAKIREKFAKSKNNKFKNISPRNKRSAAAVTRAIALDNIFTAEVEDGSDIQLICDEYNKEENVEYCQPDYYIEANYTPTDTFLHSSGSWGQNFEDLWGLKELEAQQAWDISRGSGVVVAIVDSGIDYNHPDIAANIWTNHGEVVNNGIDDDGNGFIDDVMGWDFSENDNDPMDNNRHGSHVAGTVAADDNGFGIVGVAPDAQVMAVKGLNSSGSGTSSQLASAILYAAENGADIINNSWGCSEACPSIAIISSAVRYARSLGAVLIFSAGNTNDSVRDFNPQNMTETITVGSSTENNLRSSFSNHGVGIDVAAPGGSNSPSSAASILSLKTGHIQTPTSLDVGDNYLRLAGTSMSAPHVSGVAALILSKHPEFTVAELESAIRYATDPLASDKFIANRINAFKAVNIDTPPPIAKLQLDESAGGNDLVINGSATSDYGFSHYTLEIAKAKEMHYGLNWEEIYSSSDQVDNNILFTHDISGITFGDFIIRLTVYDQSGQSNVDHAFVKIFKGQDTDDDGIPDSHDNCPDLKNPDQSDDDGNGVGNICEPHIVIFQPTDFQISQGEDTTILLSTSNVDHCQSDQINFGGKVNGFFTILPSQTTTYNVTCQAGDITLEASTTLRVIEPGQTLAQITSPVHFFRFNVPFSSTVSWSANPDAQKYMVNFHNLPEGSPNRKEIRDPVDAGTNTSVFVDNFPKSARIVRLSIWSLVNGQWQKDDEITILRNDELPAEIISPAEGTQLNSSSVTVTWTDNPTAERYYVWVGHTTESWKIYRVSAGTNTSATVENIPLDGSTVYISVLGLFDGEWRIQDEKSYVTAGSGAMQQAKIISPTPGSTITTSEITFVWDKNPDASVYYARVGSSWALADYDNIQARDNNFGFTDKLPLKNKIYVTIWSKVGDIWHLDDQVIYFTDIELPQSPSSPESPEPSPPEGELVP